MENKSHVERRSLEEDGNLSGAFGHNLRGQIVSVGLEVDRGLRHVHVAINLDGSAVHNHLKTKPQFYLISSKAHEMIGLMCVHRKEHPRQFQDAKI